MILPFEIYRHRDEGILFFGNDMDKVFPTKMNSISFDYRLCGKIMLCFVKYG